MQLFNIKYLFILALSIVLIACKPTVSLSGATIPTEAKTISVGYFTNNSSLAPPSLAQQFSEKMRDMVSQQTNLALIKNNADLQFEGYISDYNVAPISIQSNDQASQNRLTITVNVKYSNKFDVTKNFEQAFTRFADYSSLKTLSSVESELITTINKQLAEDIFNKAFNNW